MIISFSLAMSVLFLSTAAFGQPSAVKLSADHDGQWSVFLVCPDVRDSKGLVKGYDYKFVSTITAGRLEGQYGAVGAPAFLKFVGTVRDDGSLDINASGITGAPETTFGKINAGTPYSYTMQGKLESRSGQATRKELRPCTATFTRQ